MNDNGAVVTRAVVSARIPRGLALRLPLAGADRRRAAGRPRAASSRGGVHNSLTRVRLKPTLMLGGYGQFTYGFNYWGPTGNNRDASVAA